MMPYFEKILCGVAQEISILYFFLFNKLLNVDIYRVCLILLLLLLLLLLNVTRYLLLPNDLRLTI